MIWDWVSEPAQSFPYKTWRYRLFSMCPIKFIKTNFCIGLESELDTRFDIGGNQMLEFWNLFGLYFWHVKQSHEQPKWSNPGKQTGQSLWTYQRSPPWQSNLNQVRFDCKKKGMNSCYRLLYIYNSSYNTNSDIQHSKFNIQHSKLV